MRKTRGKTNTKRKFTLPWRNLALGMLFISAIAYYAFSHLPQPTPIDINEITSSPASVTLSFPASISITPGSLSSADITIDTGGAQVSAAQVELTYDPSKLKSLTLTQGDFLTSKLGTPKIKNGLISFVYVVPMGETGKSGVGKLATLKFKASGGNSQIAFGKGTMVAALGTRSNVLSSATGTNIILSSSTINDLPAQAGQPSTISTNPPALTDIQPAPKTANSRTFDETGNFDYSKPIAQDPLGTPAPVSSDSAFALFLAKIKALFGIQNGQN